MHEMITTQAIADGGSYQVAFCKAIVQNSEDSCDWLTVIQLLAKKCSYSSQEVLTCKKPRKV